MQVSVTNAIIQLYRNWYDGKRILSLTLRCEDIRESSRKEVILGQILNLELNLGQNGREGTQMAEKAYVNTRRVFRNDQEVRGEDRACCGDCLEKISEISDRVRYCSIL